MVTIHSHTHDHDIIKVVTVLLQLLGNFVVTLVALATPNRRYHSRTEVSIFAINTLLLLAVNAADVLTDLCTNKKQGAVADYHVQAIHSYGSYLLLHR